MMGMTVTDDADGDRKIGEGGDARRNPPARRLSGTRKGLSRLA